MGQGEAPRRTGVMGARSTPSPTTSLVAHLPVVRNPAASSLRRSRTARSAPLMARFSVASRAVIAAPSARVSRTAWWVASRPAARRWREGWEFSRDTSRAARAPACSSRSRALSAACRRLASASSCRMRCWIASRSSPMLVTDSRLSTAEDELYAFGLKGVLGDVSRRPGRRRRSFA
jgi:hypothetical protein